MRQVEPFSYYVEHASAIEGFGGGASAPDPRYCFHTHYEEVRPGRVTFHLRMTGAEASAGELTLRVHGYKPGSNADISLVAGARRVLAGLGEGEHAGELVLTVRFSAVQGVQYALYGFFSEPSDLRAEEIIISIDEHGPAENDGAAGGRSSKSHFAATAFETSARLYASVTPSLHLPVSQDCTMTQLASVEASEGKDTRLSPGEALTKWGAVVSLAVLKRYGMLQAGAATAVVGRWPAGLADALRAQGCRILDSDMCAGSHDFLISFALDEPTPDPAERYQLIRTTLSCVAGGGLAVFVLRYLAAPLTSADLLQFCRRNEIEQWALRLIGLGYDVAQLAFGSGPQRVVQPDGTTPFVFIVRKR
jgi:hypothetical protein